MKRGFIIIILFFGGILFLVKPLLMNRFHKHIITNKGIKYDQIPDKTANYIEIKDAYAWLTALKGEHLNFFIWCAFCAVMLVWFFFSEYRDHRYNVAREIKLSDSKFHNMRNHYTILTYLLDENQYNLAQEYVENSAAYYSKILAKPTDYYWTIENELDLLYRFYNAEKLIYSEVEIITEFNGLNIKEVSFLPDLLPTFLHNSMKHAFKYKSENRKFKIVFKKEKKELVVEVSDNGIGKENPSEYWPEGKQTNGQNAGGLNRALWRVYYVWQKKSVFMQRFIEIVKCGPEIGTTIKFSLPYEITAKDVDN